MAKLATKVHRAVLGSVRSATTIWSAGAAGAHDADVTPLPAPQVTLALVETLELMKAMLVGLSACLSTPPTHTECPTLMVPAQVHVAVPPPTLVRVMRLAHSQPPAVTSWPGTQLDATLLAPEPEL